MNERVRFKRRAGKAGPSKPGEVDLYFDATLRQLRLVNEAGQVSALSSGGGVSAHPDLTGLAWSASGHTGTASRIAGFGVAGAAAYYQIGVDVQAYDAGLASLAAADTSVGIPYVSAANTWTSVGLGDLTVTSGQWRIATINGSTASTVAGQRSAHESAYNHAYLPTSGQKDALGGSTGTPGSTNPYVTSEDSRLTGAGGGAAVGAAAEYGTGATGTMTLDGTNTYSVLTLSGGNTYTVNAAQVINAMNLTV